MAARPIGRRDLAVKITNCRLTLTPTLILTLGSAKMWGINPIRYWPDIQCRKSRSDEQRTVKFRITTLQNSTGATCSRWPVTLWLGQCRRSLAVTERHSSLQSGTRRRPRECMQDNNSAAATPAESTSLYPGSLSREPQPIVMVFYAKLTMWKTVSAAHQSCDLRSQRVAFISARVCRALTRNITDTKTVSFHWIFQGF